MAEAKSEPLLSPADLRDPLWLRIQAHFTGRLESHRVQNDIDKTPEATAKLRGRIAEVKYLLDLAAPPAPHVPIEADD